MKLAKKRSFESLHVFVFDQSIEFLLRRIIWCNLYNKQTFHWHNKDKMSHEDLLF